MIIRPNNAENNSQNLEYYYIEYEYLINKKDQRPRDYFGARNITEQEFNSKYEWKKYNAPYFIIPVNTNITSLGIYNCAIRDSGLYFCKITEYFENNSRVEPFLNIHSFRINNTYTFLGELYTDRIPFRY